MKSNKGITLIALVITIVVLIILATVSINMILDDDGILSAAEKSKELYQNAALKEQADLSGIEELLGSYEEKWVYDSEAKTVTKGDVTLKIGQKVQYNEGTGHTTTPDTTRGVGSSYSSNTLSTKQYTNEDLEWRVLGVNDKGQLELISTNRTTDTLTLYGKDAYLNVETKNGVQGTLDEFCDDLYGQGTGAESARSLNANDINKLANFNPETDYTGYNKVYTFQYYDGYVRRTDDATIDINEWWNSYNTSVVSFEWEINSNNVGPETLMDTYYGYQKAKVDGTIENGTISLSDFIFIGEGVTELDGDIQWLSNTCTLVGNSAVTAEFDVFNINQWGLWADARMYSFDMGNGDAWEGHLRPVVTLKLDTVVDEDGNIK